MKQKKLTNPTPQHPQGRKLKYRLLYSSCVNKACERHTAACRCKYPSGQSVLAKHDNFSCRVRDVTKTIGSKSAQAY